MYFRHVRMECRAVFQVRNIPLESRPSPVIDVTYFLHRAVRPELARQHHSALLQHYHRSHLEAIKSFGMHGFEMELETLLNEYQDKQDYGAMMGCREEAIQWARHFDIGVICWKYFCITLRACSQYSIRQRLYSTNKVIHQVRRSLLLTLDLEVRLLSKV